MSGCQVCLGNLEEPRLSPQRDKGQLSAFESPQRASGQLAVCLQLEVARGNSLLFPKVGAKCSTADLKLAETKPGT